MSQVRTHQGIRSRTVTPTRISRDAGTRPGSPEVLVAHRASRCQGEKNWPDESGRVLFEAVRYSEFSVASASVTIASNAF